MATLSVESEIDPRWMRRITRVEYHRMGEDGYFADELGEQHVELLDGLVFTVSPQSPRHSEAIRRLLRLFVPVMDRAEVQIGAPVAVSDWSEPEPDLSIVAKGDYSSEHPVTAFLLVEVSYSTLRYDRSFKRRVYAEARIPEYWVVNLVDRVVEVFTDPKDGAYASQRVLAPGEKLAPAAFPDLVLEVAALLP